MSALDNLGSHLLGRLPSKPDPRNYQLEVFLSTDPLDQAYAALLVSHAAKATKNWATALETKLGLLPGPTPPAPPAPPPPPAPPIPPPAPPADTSVFWTDSEVVLDQGQFGTCVGNGWAQWGNTLPVDDKFDETAARAIYYEATVIDGQPDDPDAPGGGQQGSTVHSGARAMKNRGRLNVYTWASTVAAITTFLKTQGSVVVGTDWYNDMFQPDANGLLSVTGGVAGGHCYGLDGFVPAAETPIGADVYQILNSWSDGWGIKGRAFIKVADFATLLAAQGEACAVVELPLAA